MAPVASERRDATQVSGIAPIPPGFLTLDAAAAFLSVSRMTVRRYIDRGELPVTRFGRSVRVDPRDLVALAAAHKDGNGKSPRQRRSKP